MKVYSTLYQPCVWWLYQHGLEKVHVGQHPLGIHPPSCTAAQKPTQVGFLANRSRIYEFFNLFGTGWKFFWSEQVGKLKNPPRNEWFRQQVGFFWLKNWVFQPEICRNPTRKKWPKCRSWLRRTNPSNSQWNFLIRTQTNKFFKFSMKFFFQITQRPLTLIFVKFTLINEIITKYAKLSLKTQIYEIITIHPPINKTFNSENAEIYMNNTTTHPNQRNLQWNTRANHSQ